MNERWIHFAQIAQRALLYEIISFPKPGLVDPIDRGAHRDMDAFLFVDSACALMPYFLTIAQTVATSHDRSAPQLFSKLQAIGQYGEELMYRATNQVNTHKGALFALGLAIAASQYYEQTTGRLCHEHAYKTIQALIQLIVMPKKRQKDTAGGRLYTQYGIKGALEMAQSGYALVFEKVLPFLKQQTGDWNDRLVHTLLYIALHIDDTTFLARSQDLHMMSWLRYKVERFFACGGMLSSDGRILLDRMCAQLKNEQLTLGGCADVLSITLYFFFLPYSTVTDLAKLRGLSMVQPRS